MSAAAASPSSSSSTSARLTVEWLRGPPLNMGLDTTMWPEAQLEGVATTLRTRAVFTVDDLRLAALNIGNGPSINGSSIINAAFPDTLPAAAALREKLKAWATVPTSAAG